MRRFLTPAVLLLAAACATAPQQPADLILTGGRVFTGDEARPWTEAVAIRGDVIAAVGPDVRALAGPGTRVVELHGRVVIPGFNDAHIHDPWPVEKATWVEPPRGTATKEAVLDALRSAAGNAPAGARLASDLPLALLDAGITRDDLDAISTTIPIRLAVMGGHSSVLNTPALRAWGIAEDAADPAGGSYGRRDGRLNGWVYEHAHWIPMVRYAATVSDDELRAAIADFEAEALRYGITSVQTMSIVAPDRLERILASASPRLRWRVMHMRMAPYDGSAGLRPVKYVLDGTPIERSGALTSPYADDPSQSGRLNYRLEDVEAMVRDAARGERQLLVHASGDRAAEAVLEAMERTPADWPSRRVRIEHGDLVAAELASRARALGVIVVQNPAHFTIPEVLGPRFGAARAARAQAVRSLVEAGNRFAIGSDGPLNPFLNLFFAAVNPTNPAERLTVEQSLRAYTSGAAFAEFAETRKGRIVPGMLADLAVLSQDLFAASPEDLPKTGSVMTIVGGKVVWEAPQ